MAEPGDNREIFDGLTRHQIGLGRYAGHVRNLVLEIVDASERPIRLEIMASRGTGVDTVAERERLDALVDRVLAIRHDAWVEARKVWRAELRRLAEREPEYVDAVIRGAVDDMPEATMPSSEERRELSKKLILGLTSTEQMLRLERADLGRIASTLRTEATRKDLTLIRDADA